MYNSRWGGEDEGGGGGDRYSERLKNGIDYRNMSAEERKRVARNKIRQLEYQLYFENLRRNMSKGIITLMRGKN